MDTFEADPKAKRGTISPNENRKPRHPSRRIHRGPKPFYILNGDMHFRQPIVKPIEKSKCEIESRRYIKLY